jgi:hypothetical protein
MPSPIRKVDLKLDWATHAAAKYACENWHYSKCSPSPLTKPVKIGVWFDHSGVEYHPRNIGKRGGYDKHGVKKYSSSKMRKQIRQGKHRYLFPLDELIRIEIEKLRKPYPKRAVSKENVASLNHREEGSAILTTALQQPHG